MKLIMILTLSWIMLSCNDPIVSTESSYIGQAEGTRICSLGAGFCMQCGLNLTGGYDCMPKYKMNCKGKKSVLMDIHKVSYLHESGKVTIKNSETVVKDLSTCE